MSENIAVTNSKPNPSQPAELAEELQSGTSLQNPPAPPRTVMDYIKGTLRYIGENPLQFAFNVGVGMAVSFGVKAGMIAMGATVLGPIGLAIGAAMITSVILNVGKKLWKGEEIKLEDLAGKSLFSGVLAGIIGGIFGTSFSDQINDAFKDVPSGNPNAPLPEGVTAIEEAAKTSAGDSFWIEGDKAHTLDQLLKTGKSDFAFQGDAIEIEGSKIYTHSFSFNKSQLSELSQDISKAHEAAKIPQAEHIIIHNEPEIGVRYENTVTIHNPELSHNIHINAGTLELTSEAQKFLIDQQVGYGVQAQDNPINFLLESKETLQAAADSYALGTGNYKGALDVLLHDLTHKSINLDTEISLIKGIEANEEGFKQLKEAVLESGIKKIEGVNDVSQLSVTKDNFDTIKQSLIDATNNNANLLNETISGEHHTIRERITQMMQHAVADKNLRHC